MTHECFQLRAATITDIDALLTIETTCFSCDRLTRRAFTHLIRRGKAVVTLACVDSTVVGYVIILLRSNSKKTRLYSLAVLPLFRKRGIARMLVDHAIAIAGQHGKTALTLEVAAANHHAIELYQASGFTLSIALPDYYEDGSNGWRMALQLQRGP